jgi:hypothetical protein
MRKSLSDAGVAALKPRAARYAFPDPELRGHLIRIQPSGAKSYVAVTRGPAGKQVWATIGPVDLMGIDEAREAAKLGDEALVVPDGEGPKSSAGHGHIRSSRGARRIRRCRRRRHKGFPFW